MALSRDAIRKHRGEGIREEYSIETGATLYLGSLAMIRATTGRAVAATTAATQDNRVAGVVVGFSGNDRDGVGHTDGSEKAILEYGNEWLFTVETASRTSTALGLNLYAEDDDVVGGTAVGTHTALVVVGELVSFEASDKSTGWMAIRRFSDTNILTA